MNNKLKTLILVSLSLFTVNKCLQESKEIYSGEIMRILNLRESLSKEHNLLVSSFMAHVMSLHNDSYDGEDASVLVGEWILHMNTSLSTSEYSITHIETPDSLACKFVWSIDTGKISGIGGIINGDEYDVNAAALYFDNLLFKDQKDSEKLHQEYNNGSSSSELIYLTRQ